MRAQDCSGCWILWEEDVKKYLHEMTDWGSVSGLVAESGRVRGPARTAAGSLVGPAAVFDG